jgi:hypothetical protein
MNWGDENLIFKEIPEEARKIYFEVIMINN